jgi:hypothetical protein
MDTPTALNGTPPASAKATNLKLKGQLPNPVVSIGERYRQNEDDKNAHSSGLVSSSAAGLLHELDGINN